MKNIYLLLIIFVTILICMFIGLNILGFLPTNQTIYPPESYIKWEQNDKNSTIEITNNTDNESNSVPQDYPLIINLTETMKEIPGIENINYEIYVSNDSIKQTIEYYKNILDKEGYTYHKEHSGIHTYENSEIYYVTFLKGLNAVIIYLSEYKQQTWICNSTGSVIQYQEIFSYMIDNDIIQKR